MSYRNAGDALPAGAIAGLAMSRRMFSGAGFCLAALAAWPRGAPAQDMPASAAAADLAARSDAGRRLTTEVSIDGAGPYSFIVDTCAERSVIADTVALALGLAPGRQVTVNGIARQMTAQTALVHELGFGPFRRRGLSLPVLPRGNLAADGYLGLDAIIDSRVTFDFKHQRLEIDPSHVYGPLTAGIDATDVETYGSAGRLRARGVIDGVGVTAFVDTGSEVSVINPPLLAALKARNPALLALGVETLSGVTGGEIVGDIIPVERVELQELRFTRGSVVVADVRNFDLWRLADKPALLIGMDLLRQFAKVAIDYRRREIRFELG